MGDEQQRDIRQATMILPYFNDEVAVIYLADGTAYLPVRALCRMLGLRAEIHIPRWRKLVLWTNARKLPLQTARGQRMVWCLHQGALVFLLACFDWARVAPERREQLRQATDAWLECVEQAQQLMLDDYRSLRRFLYEFLVTFSREEAVLRQWASRQPPSSQLETLLSRGSTLIEEASTLARKMLHEQVVGLVLDVVHLGAYGNMSEAETRPLFPVVLREDCELFFRQVKLLAQWLRELSAFIGASPHSQED